MEKTYFGLSIYNDYYVLEEDIQKLPFYDFWLESSKGSTFIVENDKVYVPLIDWEMFCKYFIETGRHRFQNE